MMMSPALLSAALLLLLLPVGPAAGCNITPFTILVTNSLTSTPEEHFSTHVVSGGILLGGLNRLQNSTEGFRFTYTEDPNYGPFLQSVNGLPGSPGNRTFWELLVKKPGSKPISLEVGIGCYLPKENDQIILNYKGY